MSDEPRTEDLADLYENAPCGYISLSPDGHVVKANRTIADWLCRSKEEILSRSIHDLLSFGGKIAFETHLAPLLRLQGLVNEIALDLVHSDGSKVPVIANAAEKRGPAGEHLFTRLTLFKAIDRRAYERNLIQARDKAESAAKTEHDVSLLREQFIAVLGHDLRNPLAALAAGIRMLSERESLSERGRLVTQEMTNSVNRASGLIENVLDFARGRLGGGLTLTRDPARPLQPLIEQVVAEVRSMAPDRVILTSFAITEPVDCDPGRVAQLAANLISNAVTHGAPGIPIEVDARTETGRFIFSVANGGVSIPASAREQLFQPFFRGAVRRSQQGLGLGLFIVSEIARAHDGNIDVQSSDEETRFTFSMPLSPSDSPNPSRSLEPAAE